MKHARKELWSQVQERRAYFNITPQVEEFARESEIANGLCLVNPMHITGRRLCQRRRKRPPPGLRRLAGAARAARAVSQYRHNNGEDNADAHLKRQLMAHQVVLAITDGGLDLGPWEQVFCPDFDGRRRKRVLLKAIGE